MPPMTASELPLKRLGRGKVRDIYEVDADRLLLVATDRISAFDVVMAEAIPFKGAVLTQISAWWFDRLKNVVGHHMISAAADDIAAALPALKPHRAAIAGRAMLCRRTQVFPIECVIRGFLSGSAWKEYASHGTLAGEAMPHGLTESARLEPPLFSPATKAESGHDENITIARMGQIAGDAATAELERLTRAVYNKGTAVAETRGIIIADTKFEFGRDPSGKIILIDEVMTPDSSRFWPNDGYASGRGQPSFDKQPLRDWLDIERKAGRWNGEAPPPTLPPDIVEATSKRYLDLYRRLTGAPLDTNLLA
ncbi:MAG: phosphoribosylaminoimidazolesuccinocarboxamide synthase [Micropepsaceae bacterium]